MCPLRRCGCRATRSRLHAGAPGIRGAFRSRRWRRSGRCRCLAPSSLRVPRGEMRRVGSSRRPLPPPTSRTWRPWPVKPLLRLMSVDAILACRFREVCKRSYRLRTTCIAVFDIGADLSVAPAQPRSRRQQIDLVPLHQALPSAFDRTLAAYGALETLPAHGNVRAIGVSMFMVGRESRQRSAQPLRAGASPGLGASPRRRSCR